jgi:branched-chain amino acid transport system substrate-binding protein
LALGVPGAQEWVNDLPNAANKEFVADFKKKYPGHKPSFYGAQSYDAANLIASAVNALHGNLSDKKAVEAALMKADFKSVRGDFRFGNNHFPIQAFYLQDVVKEGNDYVLKTVATIVKNNQDLFHSQCPMK